MDFSALFNALAANLPIAMLTIALIAIGWLVRDGRQRGDQHRQELAAANAAHLQTAMQVAPLASRLADCVESVERLVDRLMEGKP